MIAPASRPQGWRDLAGLGGRSELADLGRPEHVGAFFAALAAALAPRRVLDPFAVSPVVSAAVAEAVPGAAVTAISHVARSREIGEALSSAVEWRVGPPPALVPAAAGRFDLVVSSPPIGLRPPFDGADSVPRAIWRQDAAHLVLCLAAEKLAPGGKLAFLLGQGSLFSPAGLEMNRYLGEIGIELEASISFREGLAPLTYIETQVAVYSREAGPRLFVARSFPKGPAAAIVDNLLAGVEGAERELGFYADREPYRGWERAQAEQEHEALLADSPWVASIGSAALRVERLRVERQQDPGLENVVYLPEVGAGPARLKIDWSGRGETRAVVALVLDPERADAAYLEGWLNGPSGEVARRLIVSGSTLPRVRLEDLKGLRVPLPPIELQHRGARLQRRIAGVRAELAVLGERLATDASEPALDAAEHDLVRLLEGDDLDAWARRLPFPVASILARYLAAPDPESRLKWLLFFFEAFAALMAIVGLSGLRANAPTWQGARAKLRGSGRGVRLLPGATFGSWVWIGVTLAEHLREEFGAAALRADGAGAEVRTAAVGVEDPGFYAALVDEELWGLLERAKDVRNLQKGHGGVASERQLAREVLKLEQLLGALHERAGRAFDRVELIQPGAAGYDGSVYRFAHVKRLVGASGIFPGRRLTTVFPLKEDALYLVDRKERPESAVETVPLLSVAPSPDTEESVCYFYSRREDDGLLRFVSYHLPRTESVPLDGSGIRTLIDELS